MKIHRRATHVVLASTILSGYASAKQHLRKEDGRELQTPEAAIDLCLIELNTAAGAFLASGGTAPIASDNFQEIFDMLVIQGASGLAPTTLIPVAEGEGGGLFENVANADITLPDGTILRESYQWFANILPANYDENSQCPIGNLPVCPLPPSYGGPQTFANMLPPFFHENTDVSTYGYKKWPAVPTCFTTFVGIPPNDFKSDSELTSLFTTNLEDRGDNNERKRQYMSALTCDKIIFYEEKVKNALLNLVEDVTEDPSKAIISTWKGHMEELFLDLHFGTVDHPVYVREYFARAFATVANLNGICDPRDLPKAFATLFPAFCEVKEVQKYVGDRVDSILEEEDKTTITYWWNEAGLSPLAVVQEAIHNVLAFNQWISTVYLVIAAKLEGRVAIENLATGLVEADIAKIDFFEKYANAPNDPKRFDVNREAWRLLLPNNLWLSALEDSANTASTKTYGDPLFDHRGVGHIPLFIQAINDDSYDPATLQTAAFEYGTDRYNNFKGKSSSAFGTCPFLKANVFDDGNKLTPDDFAPSAIDGETMIPAGHEDLIPVFDKPKYCPFGIGYRRCPAEAMNYMFMDLLLSILGDLDIESSENISAEELALGVPCDSGDDAIPAGLVCRRDVFFVKS